MQKLAQKEEQKIKMASPCCFSIFLQKRHSTVILHTMQMIQKTSRNWQFVKVKKCNPTSLAWNAALICRKVYFYIYKQKFKNPFKDSLLLDFFSLLLLLFIMVTFNNMY